MTASRRAPGDDVESKAENASDAVGLLQRHRRIAVDLPVHRAPVDREAARLPQLTNTDPPLIECP